RLGGGSLARVVPSQAAGDHGHGAHVGDRADAPAARRGARTDPRQPPVRGTPLRHFGRAHPLPGDDLCRAGRRGDASEDRTGEALMVLLLVIAGLSFAVALVLVAETAMPEARRRHDAVESVRRFSLLAG